MKDILDKQYFECEPERFIAVSDAKRIGSEAIDEVSEVWRKAFVELGEEYKQIWAKSVLFLAIVFGSAGFGLGFTLGWLFWGISAH